MDNKFKNSLVIALLLVVIGKTLSADEKLTIMTENWPPLNYVDKKGTLKGPAVDIIRAIQNRLGINNKILVLPWTRAYNYTLNQKNTVLFAMVRSEQRIDSFKWVGPIAEKRFSFYSKKDFQRNIQTLDDAKKLLIGVQRSGFTEQFLRSQGFMNLETVNMASQNIWKLQKGRIDLIFESYSLFSKVLHQHGIDKEQFQESFIVKKRPLYIAFNKKTEDRIIDQWQKAYDELYKEGVILKIFEQYEDALSLYWRK